MPEQKTIEELLKNPLVSLSDEDLAKIPPLTEKQIYEALEKGRKARDAAVQGSYTLSPLYYK